MIWQELTADCDFGELSHKSWKNQLLFIKNASATDAIISILLVHQLIPNKVIL